MEGAASAGRWRGLSARARCPSGNLDACSDGLALSAVARQHGWTMTTLQPAAALSSLSGHRVRVDVRTAQDAAYWAVLFDVTTHEIHYALRSVGSDAAAIDRFLQFAQARRSPATPS